MRLCLLAFALLTSPISAAAQDGALQNQIALQNLQQIAQQTQIAQQANQQAMQAANDATRSGCEVCAPASAPKASLQPGTYAAPISLRLTSSTRRAHIFYTLDGWTPTAQSPPYTGPITLSSTATLQAVAIAPGHANSTIRSLTYAFPPSPATPVMGVTPTTASGPVAAAIIPEGTPVPLRFTAPIDSSNAFVGQNFELSLEQDLVVDGKVIAFAGEKAQAVVTAVDPAGRAFAPGILSFAVKSIDIGGVKVALSGTRTREGQDERNRQFLLWVPVAGPFTLLHHGQSAHIDPGAEIVATVAASTPVHLEDNRPHLR